MNRLKQPSTWAGIATLAQLLATFFPQYAPIIGAITAAGGAAAVALNEGA
jgi:hypothetical protein